MTVRAAGMVPVLAWAMVAAPAFAAEPARLGLADMARLADVAQPDLSADGAALIYTVSTVNTAEDLAQTDLWRVGYDSTGRVRLTTTAKHSESRPLWSPDGRSIAFLSDAPPPRKPKPGKGAGSEDDEEETSQVWSMPAQGGTARRLTGFP